jgi:protein SCO1/2
MLCRNRLRTVPVVLACIFFVMGVGVTMSPELAQAAYGNVTEESQIDPEIFRIQEKDFLGGKVAGDYMFLDAAGNSFKLADLPAKPLILVLSYFTCDGACSVINRTLANTLQGMDRWKLGRDYNVLTVSFDRHDTPSTMREFQKKMGFEQLPQGWRMATMRNKEDIVRLANSIGFKFFWSPRDRIFLHPSVYTVLSPTGQITRYLYAGKVDADDVELSITKAMGGEISPVNIIDFVVAACHSYNYKDGKYKLNIPLFVALGGLVAGVTLMLGGFLITKRKRDRIRKDVVAI